MSGKGLVIRREKGGVQVFRIGVPVFRRGGGGAFWNVVGVFGGPIVALLMPSTKSDVHKRLRRLRICLHDRAGRILRFALRAGTPLAAQGIHEFLVENGGGGNLPVASCARGRVGGGGGGRGGRAGGEGREEERRAAKGGEGTKETTKGKKHAPELCLLWK